MNREVLDRRTFLGMAGAAAAATAVTGLVGCASDEDGGTAAGSAGDSAEKAPAKEPNRICELLGIEKPVISASMGWGTSPEMVAAVSNAGGLGILGNHPDYIDYPEGVDPKAIDNVEETRYAIRHTKRLTDKPFAATYGQSKLASAQKNLDVYFNMLKEEGVNILYVYGMGCAENGRIVDTDTIKMLKDEGFTLIYREVCPTVDTMLEAQEAGADIIVCSGYGQGGHITDTRMSNVSLLVSARPAITAPLVANGCIVDAETASVVAFLGAEGAMVGTRFNASVESPWAEPFKQALLDARAEDVVEWRGAIGYWHNTPCEVAEICVAMDKAGAPSSEITNVYCGTDARYEVVHGTNVKKYGVCINDAIDRITSIKTCKEIVDEIGSAWV